MKRELKRKSGLVAVWLAVFIVGIAFLSMLAILMSGWPAWALFVVGGVLALLIFLGVITQQWVFQLLFGVIGVLILFVAVIIKLVR